MGHEVWELDKLVYGQNLPAWHGLGVVVDGQGSGLATQVLEKEYHDDTSKDVDTLLSQLDV